MRGAQRRFAARRARVRRRFALLLCLLPLHCWAKDPATLYTIECQGCHLSDGSGGLASIPSLDGQVGRFLDVAGGREYLVRVPGVALSSLSDRDLADVLNWVLQRFGPAESVQRNAPYTAAEVAQLRAQPLTELTATRTALLELIASGTDGSP